MLSKIKFFAFILSAFLLLAGCRREEQARQPAAAPTRQETQPGGCPKIEGSFFGVDKSEIRKGEAVYVVWKIPREYAATAKVERLFEDQVTDISSTNEEEGEYFQGKLPAMPQQSTKIVLKATGPEGCQPLELTATVTVVE